jgi:hypothetical protein
MNGRESLEGKLLRKRKSDFSENRFAFSIVKSCGNALFTTFSPKTFRINRKDGTEIPEK